MKTVLSVILALCAIVSRAMSEWEYLDNGKVRIGVDRSRGACIGWFGERETQRNLLNHWDEERFGSIKRET